MSDNVFQAIYNWFRAKNQEAAAAMSDPVRDGKLAITDSEKQIEEFTLGLTQILWKNASYGDLKLMFQVSYVDRTPWFVAPNTPSKAHMGMGYINLRYDLP